MTASGELNPADISPLRRGEACVRINNIFFTPERITPFGTFHWEIYDLAPSADPNEYPEYVHAIVIGKSGLIDIGDANSLQEKGRYSLSLSCTHTGPIPRNRVRILIPNIPPISGELETDQDVDNTYYGVSASNWQVGEDIEHCIIIYIEGKDAINAILRSMQVIIQEDFDVEE